MPATKKRTYVDALRDASLEALAEQRKRGVVSDVFVLRTMHGMLAPAARAGGLLRAEAMKAATSGERSIEFVFSINEGNVDCCYVDFDDSWPVLVEQAVGDCFVFSSTKSFLCKFQTIVCDVFDGEDCVRITRARTTAAFGAQSSGSPANELGHRRCNAPPTTIFCSRAHMPKSAQSPKLKSVPVASKAIAKAPSFAYTLNDTATRVVDERARARQEAERAHREQNKQYCISLFASKGPLVESLKAMAMERAQDGERKVDVALSVQKGELEVRNRKLYATNARYTEMVPEYVHFSRQHLDQTIVLLIQRAFGRECSVQFETINVTCANCVITW